MVSAAFVNAGPFISVRPALHTASVSRRAAPVMSMRKNAARLASVPASLLATAPVLATEGTGEGLGIDTPLLFIPLVAIPAIFFIFFIQFGRAQSNEDFNGPYDQRRN